VRWPSWPTLNNTESPSPSYGSVQFFCIISWTTVSVETWADCSHQRVIHSYWMSSYSSLGIWLAALDRLIQVHHISPSKSIYSSIGFVDQSIHRTSPQVHHVCPSVPDSISTDSSSLSYFSIKIDLFRHRVPRPVIKSILFICSSVILHPPAISTALA
jgi:hypothetical protein